MKQQDTLALVAAVFGICCIDAFGSDYPSVEPKWQSPPTTVTINECSNAWPRLEFGTNNLFVCVWWWPPTKCGDYEKLPGSLAVYDLNGRPVTVACDTNGALTDDYVTLFPRTAWRTRFSEFVKDAQGWGFSSDYRFGLRLVKARPGRIVAKIWTAELWQFQPQMKRLWETELPEMVMRLNSVGFFKRGDIPLVLLAFGGTEGFILAQEDGRLVDRLQYGHIETEEEQKAYKRKFHLGYSDGDPALRFSSHALSCEPTRRSLACGAFWGRRVRVVSLDAPYKTEFEANTEDHPNRPWGGVWKVDRVEFAGSQYLVVDSSFGGRLSRHQYYPCDIFDTSTWKVVWHENSGNMRAVTISPDNRKLALMRNNVLEIGDFVPEPRHERE